MRQKELAGKPVMTTNVTFTRQRLRGEGTMIFTRLMRKFTVSSESLAQMQTN